MVWIYDETIDQIDILPNVNETILYDLRVHASECRQRRQAIVWTNAGILSIGPKSTNVSKILIENIVRKLAAILSRTRCVNTINWVSAILLYIVGHFRYVIR